MPRPGPAGLPPGLVRGQTSVPGVFAAGDVTTVPFKQIIIATGDGARETPRSGQKPNSKNKGEQSSRLLQSQ